MIKIINIALLTFLTQGVFAQVKAPFKVPVYKKEQLLVSHKDNKDKPYLAFPTLFRLNDHEVLIPFKRGMSHGGDREADSEVLLFNTTTNKVVEQKTIGNISGKIFQLTVPVRFPDDTIYYFADMQNRGWDGRNYRTAMQYTNAGMNGLTTNVWQELPLAGGREFSYPFDFIVEGNTIYMLAMSFGYRPGDSWSVSILSSEDAGRSWTLKADLSEKLNNGAFNESSFIKDGDDFIVVLRGYTGQSTTIARFDKNFNLIKSTQLTGDDEILPNYIGWPRLFQREGNLYVIGRVWNKSAIKDLQKGYGMENSSLGLLKLDKNTFEISKICLLDNGQVENKLKDGYYAGYYWQNLKGESLFNVVTYRANSDAQAPDIIRLEYKWDEVK